VRSTDHLPHRKEAEVLPPREDLPVREAHPLPTEAAQREDTGKPEAHLPEAERESLESVPDFFICAS
jgi:hypothetical protein